MMANEQSNPQAKPQPQSIPLAKIHDLPGVFIQKQPDKSYGGLVASIQATGVKEAVILRLREDGEYQLVAGYRRRRASELAKKQEIPAYVYEMTLQEAAAYYRQAKSNANVPIPGKLADPKAAENPAPTAPTKEDKPQAPTTKDEGKQEKTAAPTAGEKPKEAAKPTEPAPATPGKEDKPQASTTKDEDKQEKDAAPVAGEKPKEAAKSAEPVPAAPGKEDKPQAPAPKDGGKQEKGAAPTAGEKPKETAKPAEPVPAAPGKEDKPQTPTTKAENKQEKAAPAKAPAAVTGPAAAGPAGTAISQVFDQRLDPPDEKALKSLPSPKEGESYFITLHPAYLEKSKFNTFSVDTNSENFKELLKSVELVGIKDPVLSRINPEGGLEILSGQRRHLAAKMLNYPVPAIIQKIDDADAKIIVADGNLHRDKISTYDLSRALRMKMEGMKQKSGRRKKGEIKAEELDSDEKLAKEMGMSVSKLNRILRLSEASKDVCDRVDDGSLTISIASAISFLKPQNQDETLHLADLGYKVSTERVEYLKKVEKAGKLDETSMRAVLSGKNILDPPKVTPPTPSAPAASAAPEPPPTSAPAPTPVSAPASTPTTPSAGQPPIPASPDVPTGQAQAPNTPAVPAAPTKAEEPAKEDNPFKGEQERPEHTKVILTGDRLRRYFPDVNMTPREIEESIYEALEEHRQRQLKQQQRNEIFKKSGPTR